MNKWFPFVLLAIIFLASALYLHQKIQIYVQAYRLSSSYNEYNELIAKRDYLMYNFSKEISIARVNQWAQHENFQPVSKEKILALRPVEKQRSYEKTLARLLDRILGASTTASTALANEKE